MLSDYVKKYEIGSIVGSLFMLVVGVLLIVYPASMINVILWIFAIGVLADGIVHVAFYISMDADLRIFSNDLLEGILALFAGILIVCNMHAFAMILPIAIGFWIIMKSLIKFQLSFSLQSIVSFSWVYLLLVSLLSLMLGILIIVQPFNALLAITVASGIVLIVSEAMDLSESIYVLKQLKKSTSC